MSQTSLIAVVLLVSICRVSAFSFPYPFNGPTNPRRSNMPRCPLASKPCRVRAVLQDPNFPTQEIAGEPCSCPSSMGCSSDWEADRDRVLIRELVTDGNVNITLSMMFCTEVQPMTVCSSGQVALQLVGFAHIPTEVQFIHCACPDTRPLIKHQQLIGQDFRTYQSFVCANSKKTCNVRRGARDTCMVRDPETHWSTNLCTCPRGRVCRPPNYPTTSNPTYTCRRPL